MCKDLDNKLIVIDALEATAAFLAAQGVQQPALCLFAATDALRSALGAPIVPPERPFRDHPIAVLRAQLGDAEFAAIWRQGSTLLPKQAIAEAQTLIDSFTALSTGPVP
jgi:hypothetical protein